MRIGIGQDTHPFEEKPGKPLILGGVLFEKEPGLKGNSDCDVVLHAVLRALDSILGTCYLGPYADKLCLEQGITDSKEYLKPALQDLKGKELKIASVSVALECKRPKIIPKLDEMRKSIAGILGIEEELVGITAETGEGMTEFGKGKGIRALSVVAVEGKE